MNKLFYSTYFIELINTFKNKKLFLGTGNLNAKIVIIGKEAAIDREKSSEQYVREIENNIKDWKNNHLLNCQFTDVSNWLITGKYNPLYPYKGQINKVESRNKDGKIIRGKNGTSKTWYNYQKITDSIYFNGNKSEIINFHEYIFCSELNQETGSYSKDILKNIRNQSIDERKELFSTPFFKAFPITIVAVGHYVRDFDINLEHIFEMHYDSETSNTKSEGLKNEYINLYYDNKENPSKLLIHTNQLSMVSNELINRLGTICNNFINKKTL